MEATVGADEPLVDGIYADFDVSKPNVARVYDAMLGGKDNFAADREYMAEILRFAPMAPLGAVANRQFLRRVVQYLAVEAGVTQFLDLGSGLPTQGNVSEIAHRFNPRARVVLVDDDPVVYSHSKALLTDAETTEIILGDVRTPADILADPVVQSMIDFEQPVGLLFFAVLHHVEDGDRPDRIVAEFRDAMPGGSYLAISSLRLPGPEWPELRAITIEGEKVFSGPFGPMRWREDEEIRAWFDGWELIPPGLVPLGDWQPPVQGHTPYPEIQHSFSGGVARKGQP
jgi:SAM-dependent methyltransferase